MAAQASDTVTTVIPGEGYGNEIVLAEGEAGVISGESGELQRRPDMQKAVVDFLQAARHVVRADADAQSALGEFPVDVQNFIQTYSGTYDLSGILGPYYEKAGIIQASAVQVGERIAQLPEQILAMASNADSGRTTHVGYNASTGGDNLGGGVDNLALQRSRNTEVT